ncbi:PREDICTED: pupal cuticle protein 20-like [Nicrophorus vespilloides]|uniref:Pupal cuticle protein 20-like n=1 Tax=Nicrophorus vespilloides TaxID=110193 RepID=A0ABM1ML41_NICVS|nr:PREDICTED: pupal cuticle protein 20-like [Nicrophorus vespilloides]
MKRINAGSSVNCDLFQYKHLKYEIVYCFLLVRCCCGWTLENTYLPPGNAPTAGGNGNFLNAPSAKYLPANTNFGSQGFPSAPSTQYGTPSTNGHFAQSNNFGAQAPSTQYDAPAKNFGGQSNIPSGQYGAPSGQYGAPTSILRFNNQNQGDGSYKFEFETENKISQQETGELKNDGSQEGAQSVEGSYSYMGDDGKTYTVHYVADENGFRPVGDHIAEEIQTLAKNAAQTSSQGYNGNAQASYYNGPSSQQFQSGPAKPSFNQQSGYQY